MLEGAIPYAFVTPGELGSIDWSMFIFPVGKFNPIFSGVGKSSSSADVLIPLPNWISIPSSSMRVTKRLGTFFNFNRYGISSLYTAASGSFRAVFCIDSNTVSWARYGTSVQVFPSESTIESIPIKVGVLISSKGILNL